MYTIEKAPVLPKLSELLVWKSTEKCNSAMINKQIYFRKVSFLFSHNMMKIHIIQVLLGNNHLNSYT